MADTFVNFTGAGTLYNDLRRRAARAGGNLAPEFSTTSTYAVGDFCIYQDALYRCTTAITTPGAWSSSKWTAVKTMSEIKTLKTDKLDSIDVAAVFSESQTYNVGEYVTHNNHLFRCKTAITTAGAWDSTQWTSVKAMSEVKRLKDGKAEQSDLEALSSDVTNLSNTKVTRTELAATFSTAQTYDVGDYVTYNNALYRCTTAITTPGAWSSSKWVAVVALDDVADIKEEVVETSRDVADIQEDVSDLKSALSDLAITGTLNISKEITWKNGYVNNGGTILASSAAKFGIVQMNTGETLHLSTGGSSIAVISSTTENDVSVGDSVTPIQLKTGTGYESYTYTATANINIVICVKKDEYNLSVTIDSKILENSADIAELSALTDEVKHKTDNTIVLMKTPVYVDNTVAANMTTGACITTGKIRSDYDTYEYTQKIIVSAGDILTPVSTYNDAYFRYVCAYNGTSAVSSAGASSGVTSYTVPEGIDGVVVTTQISKAVTAVNVKHQTGIEDTYYLVNQKLGHVSWKGNLASGDSVELMGTNVRFNTVWCFIGHISTVGKITIGVKTSGGIVKELCSVDATNLYYRLNNGNTASVAHGLTIAEDLQIRIDSPFKVNELGGITICSDGVEYTLAETSYGTDMNGVPYLLSTGAVMTDCALSWIPKDIDKPIWVFGDSWVSMYDTRWPYYMVRDGYTNTWMLNGFAGEDTDEAYESLENLLTIRKPDYIVWLLGMNNGDSSTAVNAVWKSIYDKLVQLCTDYKINLILYTVPNTPTINNNFKNAIIRASGYRYIDGAAAVGDDGSGNWFAGYEQSATDHNHTSGKGARALYYRILADFPEIAGNGI